ncbi:MAG: hypothetical protein ACRED5_03715 [Propylenella sp.]
MRILAALCLLTIVALPTSARADCANPPAPAGVMIYNVDHTIMQYCNGTDWIAVPGLGCSCPEGDTIVMGATGWECSGGGACGPVHGSLFGFTDLTDQPTSTLVASNILQAVSGGSISISGDGSPQYRICEDDACSSETQTWGSSSGTIDVGEFLQLRLTTSASLATTGSATVTVGAASDQWDVTTVGADTTPDAFSFTDQTDVALNTQITSSIESITGIAGNVSVSISGDGSPEFRINGGSWTSGPSTITNGQTLQLRLTSNAAGLTTNSATVTVGTGSDQWDVTTMHILSYVSGANSESSNITIPATAAVGDLAVLFDYAQTDGSTPTNVVPTGWTQVVTAFGGDGNEARTTVSYKILTAGNPGSSVTGINGENNYKIMFVFRWTSTINTVTPSSWASQVTGNEPNSQVVSASGQATPLIVFGHAAEEGSGVAFSTASPAFDATMTTSSGESRAGRKIYNASPANHTIDMDDEGSHNALVSGYLRIQ